MIIIETLVTVFVIAFVALCAFGHVLLFAALFSALKDKLVKTNDSYWAGQVEIQEKAALG